MHEIAAESLMYFHGFKGALDWLDLSAARERHTQDELDRFSSVKGFVEARR